MVVLARSSRIHAVLPALLLVTTLLPLGAAALAADEYAIKAAYLYNFAKFVEWPPAVFATDHDPLRICIVGNHSFGNALSNLHGKTVSTHTVAVQELAGTDLTGCHVVFIARSQQSRLKNLLITLDGRPVLTVSDIEDFTRMGGIIGLIEVDQRIQFVINTSAVRRAGLKLSSQLLKLATVVDGNGGF